MDDTRFQHLVDTMHLEDHATDLKRGEAYPELLRAILSLKLSLSSIWDVDASQVQPNFGSNGSIDTILTAVKIEEVQRAALLEHASREKLEALLSSTLTADAKINEIGFLLVEASDRRPTSGALFTSPTYFRNYNSADAKKLKAYFVPLNDHFGFDARDYVDEMKRLKPSVVFLVTPNNPTGVPIKDEDIIYVLDNLPLETWAVIDRTLVNIKPEISTRELLKQYVDKQVAILHSFSKYKGMSQHRIGVAVYSNTAAAKVVQPHLPLGIGLEGCVKANRIVQQEHGIFPDKQIVDNIKRNKEILEQFVRHHPQFSVTDFAGNYCLLTLSDGLSSREVTSALAQQGSFVMGGHEFPEPQNHLIRLHTGGPSGSMEQFCALMVSTYLGKNQ